jgi:hypothetical protein
MMKRRSLGQGEWKSTEWIADPVRISFALVLNANAKH